MSRSSILFRVKTIGPATLICGDCYEVLPAIDFEIDPDKTACVTDPPYEFDVSGGGQMRAARKYLDLIEREGLAEGFDDSILTAALFAAVVVFCHERQLAELMGTLGRRFGRASVCLAAWAKENPPPWRNKAYLADVEFYIHAWRAGGHPVGAHQDMGRVWRGPVGKSPYAHPTVKPLDLMRKILRNVDAPVIVDPFMGSGTTGIAALEAGRRFIGIERNEAFFEIAVARVEEFAAGGAP
ncbi:MAG: site-specific DNA-methyltransferase [Amphiplicatus sp.]